MLISNKTEAQLCRVSAVHRHIHQVISILYILLPLTQDQSLTEHPTTSTRLLITQSIAVQTNKSHIKTVSNQYKKKKTLRFTASGRSQVPHVSWFLIIPQIQNSKNPFLGSNDRSQSKGIGACSIHNNHPRDLNLRSSDEHDPLTTLGSPPHTLSLPIVQETL